MSFRRLRFITVSAGLAAALLISSPALAHCDGLDGPVVQAARQALDRGDPNPVLIWVQPADEPAIRAAFEEAIAVRRLGGAAREMADRYFFETLVRLHRAGEGAPYTGLQPAGRDLGPAIPLADRAVASGSSADVSAFLAEELAQGVRDRFAELQRRRHYPAGDLAAGRQYIASYVSFIHYVEGIHAALRSPAEGHYPAETESHDHH